MRKETTFLCIVSRTVGHSYYYYYYYYAPRPAITLDFAATMSFLKSFLLWPPPQAITFRLQQQCHFSNWEHSKVHFRVSDVQIFSISRSNKQLKILGFRNRGFDSVCLWKWDRAVKFYDSSRSDICTRAFELYFTMERKYTQARMMVKVFKLHSFHNRIFTLFYDLRNLQYKDSYLSIILGKPSLRGWRGFHKLVFTQMFTKI